MESCFGRNRAAGDAVDLGQQGLVDIENVRHAMRFVLWPPPQEAHIEKIKLLPPGNGYVPFHFTSFLNAPRLKPHVDAKVQRDRR